MGLILFEFILFIVKGILFPSKNQNSTDVIHLYIILCAEMLNAFKGHRQFCSFPSNFRTFLE